MLQVEVSFSALRFDHIVQLAQQVNKQDRLVVQVLKSVHLFLVEIVHFLRCNYLVIVEVNHFEPVLECLLS